jgi:hypothetical protein
MLPVHGQSASPSCSAQRYSGMMHQMEVIRPACERERGECGVPWPASLISCSHQMHPGVTARTWLLGPFTSTGGYDCASLLFDPSTSGSNSLSPWYPARCASTRGGSTSARRRVVPRRSLAAQRHRHRLGCRRRLLLDYLPRGRAAHSRNTLRCDARLAGTQPPDELGTLARVDAALLQTQSRVRTSLRSRAAHPQPPQQVHDDQPLL